MDRKTMLAIALSVLVIFAWDRFYLQKQRQQASLYQSTQTPANVTSGATNAPTAGQKEATQAGSMAAGTPAAHRAPVWMTAETALGKLQVGDSAPLFSNWSLKDYPSGEEVHGVTQQPQGDVEVSFTGEAELAYLKSVQGQLTQSAQGFVWNYEDQNVKYTREYVISKDKPYVDLVVKGEFKSKKPTQIQLSITSTALEGDAEKEKQDRQLFYWTNKTVERNLLAKGIKEATRVETDTKYVGAGVRYFILSLVDQSATGAKAIIEPAGEHGGKISLVYSLKDNKFEIPTRVYLGPKKLDLLRATEPALDNTVDLGWFTIIAYPLLKILQFFYLFVKNYGVAIILLTVLLKVATFPLNYKSMKSMKDMAKLQPHLEKLKQKYKDDKETLNREMLQLMRTHNYNPMAGCVPILIQMPIFFALYRVLYSSIELYKMPFMFWIHDLSAKDPYYVTPIVLTLTMFVQQKLTPNTMTDPAQKRMMQFMPLMFGFMMLALPAGLTIYMLTNAIVSIIQQVILNKKLGINTAPVATTS